MVWKQKIKGLHVNPLKTVGFDGNEISFSVAACAASVLSCHIEPEWKHQTVIQSLRRQRKDKMSRRVTDGGKAGSEINGLF